MRTKVTEQMGLKSFITTVLLVIAITGCSSVRLKRSQDGSIEAPPPQDSPVVVAEKLDVPTPSFPELDPTKWSASETNQTGFIFAWTLVGSNQLMGTSGCRLRLRNRETGDTVLVKIEAKNPISIQNLKPGTWDPKRLGCGVTRVWDLEGLMREGFVVKANSMSVIGWFVFEFDDRTLLTVREGGRKENSILASQLRTTNGGWPANGSTLISGFSGKVLPSADKLTSRDEIVRVKAIGLRDSETKLVPLLGRFETCASQGMKVDPLRAGTLRMEVTYRGGKFDSVKTSNLHHALRDDLVQCILQVHEAFVMDSGGDFTLETVY